jgi:hypothetical protein
MTDATKVELDPRRLGIEGNRLLGQVEALSKWGAMFAAYAAKTLDLRERACLLEVSKALLQDAESKKMDLMPIAQRRGAAMLTDLSPTKGAA